MSFYHFMPSEVARLVLGYLRETNCAKSAQTFLNECQQLSEFSQALRNGITYPTNIGGKSLIDILNESNNNNANHCTNKCGDNQVSGKEELKGISRQLSSVESRLTHLSRTINASNNVQIFASPSTISSSPVLVNTIGYTNTTPVIVNDHSNGNSQQQQHQQQLHHTNDMIVSYEIVGKTPNKANNSPRRKSLPRRRIVSGSPVKTPLNYDTSESTIIPDTPSSPLRSDSEAPLKIDICEPLIQPEVIMEELLNFQPLHEALAVNINKRFNHELPNENNCDLQSDNNKNAGNIDTQDVQISDNTVQEIISSIELAPEYNTLLDMITEKELQMTPFKNVMNSPFATTSSSNSSLNTPKTPHSNASTSQTTSSCVVKNLMTDLKTPEKSVTLYASNDGNLTYQTPIRVTPVKLMKTNLTPCKTIFMSDINIVPNNSQNTGSVPIIVSENGINSVRSNGDTYLFKIQPNIRPLPTGYSHSMRHNRNKRIDFSKPASEFQVKRPDLIPRKILPKPSTAPPPTTTVITEVAPNESFEYINNTIVAQRKSKYGSHTNVVKSLDFHSVANDSGNANQETNSENNSHCTKKVRIDTQVSSKKIKANQNRSPMVKILRKMNVNKFLEQIHSNDND